MYMSHVPHVHREVSVWKWIEMCVTRWHWLVPVMLALMVVVLLFCVLSTTWLVRRRAQRRRAVPYYWENFGRSMLHAENKLHRDFFDDSFPLSGEQKSGIQDLMNRTCKLGDKGYRLIHARRIESSKLWLQYRRKLREIQKCRGVCDFEGLGEPCLREAVEELDLPELVPFSHRDVASDFCEAFLWLGAKPETALKIISCDALLDDTSKVSGNNARFGFGWYFAEDVSAAHQHAESGQHLYSDCYAMLLCRVILGRQRLVHEVPGAATLDLELPSASAGWSSRAGSSGDLMWVDGHPGVGSGSEETLSPENSGCRAETATVPATSSSRRHSRLGWPFTRLVNRSRTCSTEDYDSTLAELPGQPREFIVYDSTQVYPEYALVYEQCEPEELECDAEAAISYWERARSMFFGGYYPPYWTHCHSASSSAFHEMYPATTFTTVLQELADATWKHKWTRDRLGGNGLPIPKGDPNGDMPVGIRILKGWRVEDSQLWGRYRAYLQGVQSNREKCQEINVKTTAALRWAVRRRLKGEVNEAYLWHGSSPRAVMGIATEGFNLDLSGSNVGAMFGKGAYFAECSSKADEYSRDDKEGYFRGCFAVLLCRAVVGEAQVLQRADYDAAERVGHSMSFDATVGDRESAVGTYKEFVVPTADAIYPEYAVIYERLYRADRRRAASMASRSVRS